MESSQRGLGLFPSPIRSMMPYARAAKVRGIKVYHLNIGQPDIETPESALRAVQELSEKVIAYGHSEGLPVLRESMANYYKNFGVQITSDDVYVTTGASEAILFALLACCDPGDEIIVPEPFYANYLGFAAIAQVKIVPITTCLEDDFQLPAISDFESCLSSRTKAIMLCNPGNPTGQLYTGDDLAALSELVKRENLYLIVDEVYKAFCYEDDFVSALNLDAINQNVVVIDSISKIFSSCGARIGSLITRNQSIRSAVDKMAQLRLCPPFFGQQLALKCYEEAGVYVNRTKEIYNQRRNYLIKRLNTIEGVRFNIPKAAFYVMADLPVDDAEDFCKWMLSDFSYQNNTVMLAPANGFYQSKEMGKQQIRIAYILNIESLEIAMQCLELGLMAYNELKR